MVRKWSGVFLLIAIFLIPLYIKGQGPPSVFAADLQSPTKVILLPDGQVMLAEAGTGKNDGRVSIFNSSGQRHTIIDGLPSGTEPVDAVSGPNSIAVRDRTMYISIGIGDVLSGLSMQPGTGRTVNPNPSSPIFSSVLQIDFESDINFDLGPFSLTRSNHDQLTTSGSTLMLTNAEGEQAEIKMLVNFVPDTVSDPSLPGFRGPDPFDVVLDSNRPSVLYVTDGGLSRVVKVDIISGQTQDFVKFEKIRKPPGVPLGPPLIDPLPTGARQQGNSLYVALLTGFPFAQGASQIHRINLDSGTDEILLRDLTSSVDVEPVGENSLFVLQLSTNLLAIPPRRPAPGRLLRIDLGAPNNRPVVADNLELPNSMARNPATGEFFIVEIGAGRIIRLTPQ